MAKKAFVSLTGGLNNVDRPDTLEEDQLQECVNYEITGVGRLEKRTDPSLFDDKLTEILNIIFEKVLSISDPYYPPNKIDGAGGEYMLFIYGIEKKQYANDEDVYRIEIAIRNTVERTGGKDDVPITTTIKDAAV